MANSVTVSGQVLNAAQTTYARRAEAALSNLDPTAPALPGAWVIWSMRNGWTPRECAYNGIELALDA